MSLDQNLFTLHFVQNKDHPNVLDLVDPSGTVHYHKRRVPGSEYKIEVYDPMSESLLITATAPTASSKAKTLELHNPTINVELKYTGTLSFRWAFKWEEHEFEWKREQCFLLRKPDPPVLVAVTKEPTGKLKTAQVQLLDYNINRFDIDDRKGLEIVILTALLSFQDANESYHTPEASSTVVPGSRKIPVSAGPVIMTADEAPPLPPPKPAPKTGVDRVAEMQAVKGDYNEIEVDEEGSVLDYAEYCGNLLQDDAMLFITVKSSSAESVPKVLQVVEETKRIRYRAGLDEEELHQYVLYDTVQQKKGPRRINLDDDAKAKNKYTPPKSLIIHLSKIDMPELQPKTQPSDKGKKKEDKKVRPAPSLPSSFSSTPAASSSFPFGSTSKPWKNKLTRPPRDNSPNNHTQIHAPHPVSSTSHTTGVFNAPPSKRPAAETNSVGGYETPGLGLFSSYTPSTGNPPRSSYRPTIDTSPYRPPPSPQPISYSPVPTAATPSTNKPLSSASGVAQTVVAGIFERLNSHR